MKKEVTLKIEEEVYEYFKAQAEECNRPVEEIMADAVRGFYKWNYCEDEDEDEI